MPTVSVIMNCLNCSKYLHKAIDSVYAQTYKDWEIIFWDNASTDNSPEIAKSYDEKLRYFRGNETVLLGKARNLAIEKAKGEFIAFLDCDDIWLPFKLEKQMKLFDNNPKLGLVYCDCLFIYPNGQKALASKFFKFHRGDVFQKMLLTNFVVLSTAIIRSNAINECGGFLNYQVIEEYDLFLKISKYYQIDFVNEPLAKYRYHEGNISKNLDINLLEIKEVYKYWSQRVEYDIKRICLRALGNSYYGLSRRALFHLKNKNQAKEIIKKSFNYGMSLKYILFLGFCYLPMGIIQGIRKFILSLK
ncbi:MAG: glycosyltransferase [Candidatus Aminicenantes bacterium]|nr:glycosyltransferase [Candidatus Aminicenantes bacterium]